MDRMKHMCFKESSNNTNKLDESPKSDSIYKLEKITSVLVQDKHPVCPIEDKGKIDNFSAETVETNITLTISENQILNTCLSNIVNENGVIKPLLYYIADKI